MNEIAIDLDATQISAIATLDSHFIDDVDEIAACYPLMRQLRPNLTSEAEFIARWRRQTSAGYRLLALWENRNIMALAGFRVQENLVHGLHLYIDDLVTQDTVRSRGYGQQIMIRLALEGRKLGCSKLTLDTALTNVLGHRFYYRNGLLATALRFQLPLS